MAKTKITRNARKNHYRGNPSGSNWNKWDLHVHTPSSIVHGYGGGDEDSIWEKFLRDLESLPKEIRVLGINDYLYVDGYRRLITEKDSGRLPNIDLLLPVVELRLSNFSGHSDLRKVNYHIVFSNELGPDQIENFLLRKLKVKLKLDDGNTWEGTIAHQEGLEDLGKAIRESTPKDKQRGESDLLIGFSNAAVSFEIIQEALKESMLEDKYLCAVGLSEWDQMRWDGGSGAIKKDIINKSDFVITCSPNPKKYFQQVARLKKQGVTHKLIDCSDAHHYSDSTQPNRLGNILSWLKADLTFRGLRRAIQCFEERVQIINLHEQPEKLIRVKHSPGKYIQSIEIVKKTNSKLEEKWFDCSIPFNTDLVAIIGNQGNGKSALTDIISLCGNTKRTQFSFLNSDKFRDRDKKASEFYATLTWMDGSQSKKCLDDEIDESEFERIIYVPQGFFDEVTNEIEVGERGLFYREIKKGIYSHIPESKQLDLPDLDTLIDFHTDQLQKSIDAHRLEIKETNSAISKLETETSTSEIERLKKAISVKEEEIASLEEKEPPIVEEPSESKEAHEQIDKLSKDAEIIQKKMDDSNGELLSENKKAVYLNQLLQSIKYKEKELIGFIESLKAELDEFDIEIDPLELLEVEFNVSPIEGYLESTQNRIIELEKELDSKIPSSLPTQLEQMLTEREGIEGSLEQAPKEYQAYKKDHSDWNKAVGNLIGTRNQPHTLKWYENELRASTGKKVKDLRKLVKRRDELSKEIYSLISKVSSELKSLTSPVHKFIDSNSLLKDKFNVQFDIEIVERDLHQRFFELVKYGQGTFTSKQQSHSLIMDLFSKYDFANLMSTIKFCHALLDLVKRNHRHDPPINVDIQQSLRRGKKVEELYNLIFGLEYLEPQFSISLDNKPIKLLSPGERGILLLIFYLIIDQGNEPLIIDQPEGNLNNQSIFFNLVPVFHEVKERRQVIIVTHNPNLAVVCDAEQIVHAKIDAHDDYRVSFECGALENPKFNELSLNVLEGTRPAFTARSETYE